jgi:CHAT domain-containing protein/tetratricopeptide (TPR) repeat protein
MPQVPREAILACLRAFRDGAYRSCVDQASALVRTHSMVTLELLQVILISLQRLGDKDLGDELGSQFLEMTAGHPWDQALLQLTLGQAELHHLLDWADTEGRRCQAHYYAGARLETLGRTAQAHSQYRKVLALQTPCVQKEFAEFALGMVSSAAFPQRPSAVEQQLREMNERFWELFRTGATSEAFAHATQMHDLCRQFFGREHPHFAVSLKHLARIHQAQGHFAMAESLVSQALDIERTILAKVPPDLAGTGEDHPDLSATLDLLGELTRLQGKYSVAESLFQQALSIRARRVGEDSPGFAGILNNLAVLYRTMGDYTAAEPLMRRALAINRNTPVKDDPGLVACLNNLAVLCQCMGNFAEAEALLREATDWCRLALGPDHPQYLRGRHNLAGLYQAIGNYAEAELILQDVLEKRRQILGEGHPDFARTLNGLANLSLHLGWDDEAERLERQVLTIRRNTLGEEHPDFARSLTNLAVIVRRRNELQAISLCRQALAIQGRVLGEKHPDFTSTLHNLVGLYCDIGNYQDAEHYAQQTVQIQRATLGEEHPDFVHSLDALARVYYGKGDFAAAEPLNRRAVAVRRKTLGEEHPLVVFSLHNLGFLNAAMGRPQQALDLLKQAAALEDHTIGQVFSFASESQRMRYFEQVRATHDIFLSLILQQFSHSPAEVGAALESVLRKKGIGIEALAVQRDAVFGGRYPELKPKLQDLTSLRRQIAQRALAGPGPEGLEAHQHLLDQWNVRRERLEGEIARHIPEMKLEAKLRVNRQAVAGALPSGTVLIEFVRFRVADFRAVLAKGQSQWQPARYVAFVLPAGKAEQVALIDLGEAEPIDRMIADFRSSILGKDKDRAGRDVVRLRVQSLPPATTSPGQSLRKAIFDKLTASFGSCKRLLLAADGNLTRLPFEVLPTDNGRRLIDDYQISYLDCGRDVLRFGAAPTGQPTAALVVADPDFDLSAKGSLASPNSGRTRWRHSRDLQRDLQQLPPAERLPATRVEGERIVKLLRGAQLWLEGGALEGRLKQACRSPRILHLATHGFFLEDQQRDSIRESRDLEFVGGPEDGMGRLTGARPENPLLRSGLILAGFNTWLQKGNPHPQAEDGLLTAEDVSGLDLLATELVVLSACETGLGEVHSGEGVFGLRRAFVLAGAKTLVMSLWAVPDQQTQELMENFYRRILAGQGRADALREAQLAMKAKNPDPYYWAAFVCLGNPGPLLFRRMWYYNLDGMNSHGPISDAELKEMIRTGTLTRTGKVSLDGSTWHEASHLKGVRWPAPDS